MACKSCKQKDELIQEKQSEINPAVKKVRDYILKFLLFCLMAPLLTIIIIPISLVVLFRVTVLSKSINLLPVVKALGERIFKEKEDEEEDDGFENDEDYDNESAEDYEPINEHEIIVVNNVK